MPDQLKLPFYLWTREAVARLIEREYGIAVPWLTTVGRFLSRVGNERAEARALAYERNDAATARWLDEEYPALARQAKREKATIYWGDEWGLRSDHISGTQLLLPSANAGSTRHRATLRLQHDSAITNRGALAFMVFEGKFHNAVFIDFMKRLLKQATQGDLPHRRRSPGASLGSGEEVRCRERRSGRARSACRATARN